MNEYRITEPLSDDLKLFLADNRVKWHRRHDGAIVVETVRGNRYAPKGSVLKVSGTKVLDVARSY